MDVSPAELVPGGKGDGRWALAAGDLLGGYRVVLPLGRGGMGEVYLVENVQTNARFALKLLPPELTGDSPAETHEGQVPSNGSYRSRGGESGEGRAVLRERFRREAAVLQKLRHDGIVMVHHAGEEGGRFFLVMDLVEGPEGRSCTLADELRRRGRLPEEEARRIAVRLARALRAAHEAGVVHRDLKPGNVLLDREGKPKLADFGLARLVGDEFHESLTRRSVSLSMARTGGADLDESERAIIGTYEYMSPEQKAGRPADERSDIYSLGLVVYRMLTGKRAEGSFPGPSKLGCAPGWDRVVDLALATRPEDRFASVAELEDALCQDRALQRRGDYERRPQKPPPVSPIAAPIPEKGLPEGAGPLEAGFLTGVRAGPARAAPARSRRLKVALAAGSLAAVAAVAYLASPASFGRGGAREPRAPARTHTRGSGPAVELPARRARERGLEPALTLDLGDGVKMDLVLIPAGGFSMGSRESEVGRDSDEGSRRAVRITRDFYMGKYEVTQAQYEHVMATWVNRDVIEIIKSRFEGENNPAEKVSWDMARDFCKVVSRRTGRTVRLPTEAEWEYACRAGTVMPFHFGHSLGADQANFDGRHPYGYAAVGARRGRTTPVGSFPANAWGLHDMHGNVWEWCSDHYDDRYFVKSPPEDPKGPASTGYGHVLRGGSWSNFGHHCRSASRTSDYSSTRYDRYGFRAVAEIPAGPSGPSESSGP